MNQSFAPTNTPINAPTSYPTTSTNSGKSEESPNVQVTFLPTYSAKNTTTTTPTEKLNNSKPSPVPTFSLPLSSFPTPVNVKPTQYPTTPTNTVASVKITSEPATNLPTQRLASVQPSPRPITPMPVSSSPTSSPIVTTTQYPTPSAITGNPIHSSSSPITPSPTISLNGKNTQYPTTSVVTGKPLYITSSPITSYPTFSFMKTPIPTSHQSGKPTGARVLSPFPTTQQEIVKTQFPTTTTLSSISTDKPTHITTDYITDKPSPSFAETESSIFILSFRLDYIPEREVFLDDIQSHIDDSILSLLKDQQIIEKLSLENLVSLYNIYIKTVKSIPVELFPIESQTPHADEMNSNTANANNHNLKKCSWKDSISDVETDGPRRQLENSEPTKRCGYFNSYIEVSYINRQVNEEEKQNYRNSSTKNTIRSDFVESFIPEIIKSVGHDVEYIKPQITTVSYVLTLYHLKTDKFSPSEKTLVLEDNIRVHFTRLSSLPFFPVELIEVDIIEDSVSALPDSSNTKRLYYMNMEMNLKVRYYLIPETLKIEDLLLAPFRERENDSLLFDMRESGDTFYSELVRMDIHKDGEDNILPPLLPQDGVAVSTSSSSSSDSEDFFNDKFGGTVGNGTDETDVNSKVPLLMAAFMLVVVFVLMVGYKHYKSNQEQYGAIPEHTTPEVPFENGTTINDEAHLKTNNNIQNEDPNSEFTTISLDDYSSTPDNAVHQNSTNISSSGSHNISRQDSGNSERSAALSESTAKTGQKSATAYSFSEASDPFAPSVSSSARTEQHSNTTPPNNIDDNMSRDNPFDNTDKTITSLNTDDTNIIKFRKRETSAASDISGSSEESSEVGTVKSLIWKRDMSAHELL